MGVRVRMDPGAPTGVCITAQEESRNSFSGSVLMIAVGLLLASGASAAGLLQRVGKCEAKKRCALQHTGSTLVSPVVSCVVWVFLQ